LHLGADCRLRQADPMGRGGKRAFPGNSDQRFKLTDHLQIFFVLKAKSYCF
jgi:hypothetical protein